MSNYKYFIYYLDNDIYAYTDNKKISKEFDKYRNMKKIKKVIKKISKEDVNELAIDYKLQRLTNYEFIDTASKSNLIIPVTELEKITIINQSVNIRENEIYSYCWFPHSVFKSDIRESLISLKYHIFHDDISKCGLKMSDMFPNIEKQAVIDELSLFIRLYGIYLKV